MRFMITMGVALLLVAGSSSTRSQESRQLERERTYVRAEKHGAWLGVALRDMTEDLAKEMKVKTLEGALVTEVIEDSPAEGAGLAKDDIIVGFNTRTITDADDLTKAVRKSEAGAKATVVVMRGDQKKSFDIKLAKNRRGPMAFSFTAPSLPRHPMAFGMSSMGSHGLSLLELTPQLGEYFEAPNGEGLLVERVKKGSAGDKAGFKAGDVIVKIGKEEVADMEDVMRAFERVEDGKQAAVEILRKGKRQTLNLAVEEEKEEHGDLFEWRGGMAPFHHLEQDLRKIEWDRSGMERMREEVRSFAPRLREQMQELRTQLKKVSLQVRTQV
jgi:C-terminal processing protease CtpA/Prc